MSLAGPDSCIPSLVDLGRSGGATGQCLVWRFTEPMLAISSAIIGGGIGPASWAINVTVEPDYSRMDPMEHLADIADSLGLTGRGLALMTAVDVSTRGSSTAGLVSLTATVGVRRPVWAHDLDRTDESSVGPGTINIVAAVPQSLGNGALVNAVATITEAKVQAMYDHGIAGTGTASDAVCLLCPIGGVEEPFGGPRSVWGRRLADATYEAVAAGIVRQRG
jgi:adenosylcobinamide hydrolase